MIVLIEVIAVVITVSAAVLWFCFGLRGVAYALLDGVSLRRPKEARSLENAGSGDAQVCSQAQGEWKLGLKE